jgi:hypothetical protein
MIFSTTVSIKVNSNNNLIDILHHFEINNRENSYLNILSFEDHIRGYFVISMSRIQAHRKHRLFLVIMVVILNQNDL